MHVLDKQIRKKRLSPLTFVCGFLLAAFVFACMGFFQLNVEYTPPAEPEPLMEFHLPPPPPPPPAKVPPKKTAASINFNLPAVVETADVPLGFLNVEFGLSPKELTDSQINLDDTLDNYQTDGIEDLNVYEVKDVTVKPKRLFRPELEIPRRKVGYTKKPFSFIVICRIDKKGRTSNIHIIDCPYPDAIPELKRYVQSWRYKPAQKDGKIVSSLIQVRITYHPSSGNPFSTS